VGAGKSVLQYHVHKHHPRDETRSEVDIAEVIDGNMVDILIHVC
jgi:hypothetical protein